MALRQLALNRSYLDPIRYSHLRRELGLQTNAEMAVILPVLTLAGVDRDRLDRS
jgi:hypothetical protein